jgi:methionine-rich copper-binding protein CopC
MKKTTFLFLLLCTLVYTQVKAQCVSSATSYQLIVSNNTTINANAPIDTYICSGATLIDSASCCTRSVHIEPNATYVVGPMAYGSIYIKNGGTFNGMNTQMFWVVYAETGAIILNYSGAVVNCTAVTFPSANCFMSVGSTAATPKAVAAHSQNDLHVTFSENIVSGKIEVMDMSGRVVKSQDVNQATESTIAVHDLAAGVYYYRILIGEETVLEAKFFQQ